MAVKRALLALLLALPAAASAASTSPVAGRTLQPPVQPPAGAKLAVLIAVDQMRADYLERFEPYYGERGFKRLQREGAVFTHAAHPHGATETCPGHALLGSGLYPSVSGIVSNTWFDRATGKTVYCTDEPGKGPSAARFDGPSLARRFKGRYPQAMAVGVSLKDRAAIMPPGLGADAAYWLGEDGFTSSKAYPPHPEMDSFKVRIDSYLAAGPVWNYSLPQAMAAVCPKDIAERHDSPGSLGRSFPHPLKTWKDLRVSPFGNTLVVDEARQAVDKLKLGRHEGVDLLTVSFSAIDYIGHNYGPDSCEMADAMARLDGDIGDLLEFLETRLGKDRVLAALSADHGAPSLPEVAAAEGRDAGRIHLFVPDSGTVAGLPAELGALERAAAARFGYSLKGSDPVSQGLVAYVSAPWVWLRPEALAKRKLKALEVRAWMKQRLGGLKGIEAAFSWEDIKEKKAPDAVVRAFRADRSGDVYFVLKRDWIVSEQGKDVGADHGTLWDYDTRVPLVWWGAGVSPSRQDGEASTAQIASNFARLLGLPMRGFSDPRPLPGLRAVGKQAVPVARKSAPAIRPQAPRPFRTPKKAAPPPRK